MHFKDSTLLITGGTGSLGVELTKQLLKLDVKSIRVLCHSEYRWWMMNEQFNDSRIRYLFGDIRDRDRMDSLMRGVDYVIHAAALKHITTGETNPQEVLKTNCMGSINVVDMAHRNFVKRVIGISSDKAVYPIGLYGSSKKAMESLFKECNRWAMPITMYSCIRLGNYFESSGNVFKVWAEQARTGTCTLTDAMMYRYFITIENAAKITLQCLHDMRGGEIFVPKMKEYSMMELLRGKYPDVMIKITGKRAGERLHEPLFTDEEHVVEKSCYYEVSDDR